MRNATVMLMVLVLLLFSVGCQRQASQTGAERSPIGGFSPYTLGAIDQNITSINPTLETGRASVLGSIELSYQAFAGSSARNVATADYHGLLKGGAEGLTRDAMLALQFHDGKLAAVFLYWPNVPHLQPPPFPPEMTITTQDAQELYRRLLMKYGAPVRDELRATNGRVGSMYIRDPTGNLLFMAGNNPGLGVILGYVSAQLVEAVGEPE